MKPETFAALALVLILMLLAGWYFYNDMVTDPPAGQQAVPITQNENPAPTRLPMPPHNPVPPPKKQVIAEPGKPEEPPFPTDMSASDVYLNQRLPQLIDKQKLVNLLFLEHFIEKLVLFIDQLPGNEISRQHLPLKPPAPGFLTSGKGEQRLISKENSKRYNLYVELVEVIPRKPLLQLYRGLYPLFQKAYLEISDTKGHFNDRLIQVIDHLLQTPEPKGQIQVIHHVQRFRFVDQSLEERSAGQKIMLRMGVENSQRVKAKLKELRKGLVRQD